MWELTEKQQKQRQRTLEWQLRNRWFLTALYSFWPCESVWRILEKRSQWPHLFAYSPLFGVPFWDTIWVNIFNLVMFPTLLILMWVRIHNYRRDLLFAAQLALQKASQPPEGVWPPPPQI